MARKGSRIDTDRTLNLLISSPARPRPRTVRLNTTAVVNEAAAPCRARNLELALGKSLCEFLVINTARLDKSLFVPQDNLELGSAGQPDLSLNMKERDHSSLAAVSLVFVSGRLEPARAAISRKVIDCVPS